MNNSQDMKREDPVSEIDNKKMFLDDLETLSRKYGLILSTSEWTVVCDIDDSFTGYAIDNTSCLLTSPTPYERGEIESYGLFGRELLEEEESFGAHRLTTDILINDDLSGLSRLLDELKGNRSDVDFRELYASEEV